VADFDIDAKDLDLFHRELEDLHKHFPKEAKRLMLLSGNHARRIVLRRAKNSVIEDTGEYFESIKRGRVWVDENTGEYKIRTYSGSPTAHLIEYGHRMVGPEPDKKEVGFVLGFHVFDKAGKDIDQEWNSILEQEFDKIMKKL